MRNDFLFPLLFPFPSNSLLVNSTILQDNPASKLVTFHKPGIQGIFSETMAFLLLHLVKGRVACLWQLFHVHGMTSQMAIGRLGLDTTRSFMGPNLSVCKI